MKTRAILTMGLVLITAAPLAAQGPRARQRPLAPEMALRLRDTLQLSPDQVRQLRTLREEHIKARQGDIAARMELRSRLMAGEITRQEFRTQMTERINAMETRREQRGDPARAMLNEAQRERLQAMQRDMRQRLDARGPRGAGGREGMRRPGMRAHAPHGDTWGRARPMRRPPPPDGM
ncbi:MAG TPA: hypothetical protein VLL51_03975 [Gemmatimonadales bacterium]|nr:hypothetical protein [Gemmatimonadales bacterium]